MSSSLKEVEGIVHRFTVIDPHMWIGDILQNLGIHYDDACFCSNCERICNLLEDGNVRILLEDIDGSGKKLYLREMME